MLYAVGTLTLVGIALLFVARRVERSENIDTASSAAIPYVLGAICLAWAVVLTAGYGLYRLFFT